MSEHGNPATDAALRNGEVARSSGRLLLTLDEVAKELRLSKASVNRLIHGQLAGVPVLATVKLGRRYLVRRESLSRFVEAAEGVHSTK
jgi:excisionase family DNA binding protein